MPRVKNIRVSNIKLDGGNKIIGDKKWEVLGNNTLFLLENGGGKTSIIQLIHQVVLPNYSIQKREMKESVQKGSTVHIAVEWMPNDDYHSEFITGFCFQNYGVKRSQNDTGYGYFTYIIEYDHDEAIRLPELPFVHNGKVSNLEELKTFFKKQKGVQLYDKNIEYQQVLEQYGILASEWKNIAKVNGAEAGVTEFFSRTATTEALIEKLFIPSLLENLFHTDLDRNAITEAFRKYKDRLLELPELEKQLNDFKVVFKSSDEIIDACKQYNQVIEELEDAQKMLTRLYVTIKNDSQQNQTFINNLNDEWNRLDEVKIDLQWKIDSYEVYLKEKEAKNAKKLYETALDLFYKTEGEENSIKRKIKEQNAARAYEDYKEHLGQFNYNNAQLKAAKLKTNEQLTELEKKRTLVSQQHLFLLNQQLQIEKALKTNRTKKEQLQKDSETKIEKVRDSKEEISNKIASLNSLFERYDKELIDLKQNLFNYWDQDLSTTLKKIEDEQAAKKEKFNEIDNNYTLLEKSIDNVNQQLADNKIDLQKENSLLENTENEFEVFSELEIRLKNKTSAYLTVQVENNLFEDREIIQIKLGKLKKQVEDEITKLSIEINHFDQIKMGIEERGYHIHSELEAVKDYLISKKIDVVLGVDWITRLVMDDEKKRELVSKNPLISFSILLEGSQIQKVKRALEQYHKELTIPIILIDKNELHLQEEKEMVFAIEHSSFIFHKFNVRFRSEDWEQFVVELQKSIEEVDQDRRELKEKLDNLQGYENELSRFWNSYLQHSREEFVRKINKLNNQIDSLKEKRKSLLTEKETAEGKREQLKGELRLLQDLISELGQRLLLIREFIKRYIDIEDKKKELHNLKGVLVKVEGQILNLDDDINNLKQEIENLKGQLEGISFLIRDLRRDAKEYEFVTVDVELKTTEESYEENKALYKVLREQQSGDSKRLQHLESTLNNYKRLMERSIDDLSKFGYSVEAFSKSPISFDKTLLAQFEFELTEIEEQLDDARTQKENAKTEFDRKNAVLEKMEKDLDEKYSEEKYEYSLNAEEEFNFIKSELALNENKQTEINLSLEKITKQESKNKTAIDELDALNELFIGYHNSELLSDNEWNKENPNYNVRESKGQIDKKKQELTNQRYFVKEKIAALREDIKATGNTSLIQMTTDLTKILDNLKDDYEEIIESFVSLIERIEKYEESYEIQKKQSIEGRNQLIEMMFDRAELIYKNILEIPKSSQIVEKGEILSLFTMQWPKKEIEDTKHQIRIFIDNLLEELVLLQHRGVSSDELEEVFDKKANMLNILNCYADIARCRLKALKPRNVLLASNKEYFLWDEISGWSQGEKHAARMSMFIALNTHLRKKRFSKENSWKFLIVDNPFGEASADHVVKPMITLAEKTNTQLFCLTGIKEKSIQVEFKTVISNQYVLQRGLLVLNSEEKHKNLKATELESFFYAKQ